MSEMLDAALEYARRHGVAVFPCWWPANGRCACGASECKSPGKHPIGALVPHGFMDATTDAARIREWWTRFPNANLATPTSSCVVLDVDPRHSGDETLAALEQQHGPLPDTPELLTGGGGRHIYFARPSVRITSGSGKLGAGLDIKADGGYVILPPSNHVSGLVYRDEVTHPLFETPLAPMPSWMLALATAQASTNGTTSREDWAALLVGAPEGKRHDVAARIAGHYLGKRLPATEVTAILRGYAAWCSPPFPAEEAVRIVADLAAKDAARQASATGGHDHDGSRSAAGVPDMEATPLATLTWAEMLTTPRREIEYDVPGWVTRASICLIAGAGDSLKSWFLLAAAAFTAAGRPFPPLTPERPDAPPMRQGPVLYLTAENAIEEEQRRCQLLQAGHGLPPELPITFVPAESLTLGKDSDYCRVVALVAELSPSLMCIDSAIALSGVERESDNSEVRRFMQTRIQPLSRRHGATVLMNVHAPKPPTQPGQRFSDEHVARGAGDWRNSVDFRSRRRSSTPSAGAHRAKC